MQADLEISTIPTIEFIHQKIYAAASQPKALNMDAWHGDQDSELCNTTHCRAGWVTALAGRKGKQLEERHGTELAATLIYFRSDPTMKKTPNFFCDNKAALRDMKKLADLEAATKGIWKEVVKKPKRK
jgi:hypothetical protein